MPHKDAYESWRRQSCTHQPPSHREVQKYSGTYCSARTKSKTLSWKPVLLDSRDRNSYRHELVLTRCMNYTKTFYVQLLIQAQGSAISSSPIELNLENLTFTRTKTICFGVLNCLKQFAHRKHTHLSC